MVVLVHAVGIVPAQNRVDPFAADLARLAAVASSFGDVPVVVLHCTLALEAVQSGEVRQGRLVLAGKTQMAGPESTNVFSYQNFFKC